MLYQAKSDLQDSLKGLEKTQREYQRAEASLSEIYNSTPMQSTTPSMSGQPGAEAVGMDSSTPATRRPREGDAASNSSRKALRADNSAMGDLVLPEVESFPNWDEEQGMEAAIDAEAD